MLTLKEATTALSNREPFNAGNLTAGYDYNPTTCQTSYLVFSYGTLIASARESEHFTTRSLSIEPNAYDHSQTTSKHANIVKRAWGLV